MSGESEWRTEEMGRNLQKKNLPAFLQSEDSPTAFSRVDDAALDRQWTAEDTPLAFSKVEA